MEFPKPLQDRKGQYKVYLHSTPDVGDVFWSISGRGKSMTVQNFRVAEIEQYKSKLRGDMATLITWVDQSGNVAWSGLRSKSMSKNRKPDIYSIGKPARARKLTVGQYAKMKVKSQRTDSDVIIANGVGMKVAEIKDRSNIVYWIDIEGEKYWSNKSESFVRPFPEKRKAINCSDSQNA